MNSDLWIAVRRPTKNMKKINFLYKLKHGHGYWVGLRIRANFLGLVIPAPSSMLISSSFIPWGNFQLK